MNFKHLLMEHRGRVSWVYLNRPQALNAISYECMRELREVCRGIDLRIVRSRVQERVVVENVLRGRDGDGLLVPTPFGCKTDGLRARFG